MHFEKYAQSHIVIFHQYVPVTAVTINRVCYNNIHNQHATVYWFYSDHIYFYNTPWWWSEKWRKHIGEK